MEITDLEQSRGGQTFRRSDRQRLGTWSGKRTSLSVHSPEAAEVASGVAREKSDFDLSFSKTPEGECDRQGQPVSSFGPDEGQPRGEARFSQGASRRHTRSLTLSHALGVILSKHRTETLPADGGVRRRVKAGGPRARPAPARPRRARAHVCAHP